MPYGLLANNSCEEITKRQLYDLQQGKVYISASTNTTICLKNYDGRYTYFPVKNGKIEGDAILYYYEDKIEYITPYRNSRRNGLEKRFYPSGAIKSETPYIDDKKQGVEKTYFEMALVSSKGGLEMEVPYVDDKIEGVVKEYYIDGTLLGEYNYKNNFKEGLSVRYHQNGNLRVERTYKQGKKDGFEREYNRKGILYNDTPFKNGSVEGVLKSYDKKTGKPLLFVDYVNGLKTGKAIKYNDDGSIHAVINFEKDYAISGKCYNGYILTPEDLETIQYSIYRINCKGE